MVDTFLPYEDKEGLGVVNILPIYTAKYANIRKLLLNLPPWLQTLATMKTAPPESKRAQARCN